MVALAQPKPKMKTVSEEDHDLLVKFIVGENLAKLELAYIAEKYYGVEKYQAYMEKISEAKHVLKHSNISCNDFCVVVDSPIMLQRLVPYVIRLINLTFKGKRIIFINGRLSYRPMDQKFNKKKLFKKLKVVKKSDKVTTAMRLFHKKKEEVLEYIYSIRYPVK